MARSSATRSPDVLREDVIAFGDLVRAQLRRAVTAIDTLDADLAATVIDGDAVINDLYLDLEGECLDLLALQQPVAGDLRTVVAAFKILTDLERIGDLAVNLATLVQAVLDDVTDDAFAAVRLVEIGELAAEMVADAIYAFETGDGTLCRTVASRDDDLDALCSEAMTTVVRQLVATPSPDSSFPDRTRAVVQDVLVLVRDLERVGDHAVNIAARTLYMLESDTSLLE